MICQSTYARSPLWRHIHELGIEQVIGTTLTRPRVSVATDLGINISSLVITDFPPESQHQSSPLSESKYWFKLPLKLDMDSSSGSDVHMYSSSSVGNDQSARTWDNLKPLILNLYIHQDMHLDTVVNIMRNQHGFYAV